MLLKTTKTMRPYKPAPKNAAANRIRERYLHQLGLQRGMGTPQLAPHPNNNHVVVISGLPSLPEDRATTMAEGHVMEAHDFSIASRHSQHTSGGSANSGGSGESDCGSAHASQSGTHATNPNAAPHNGQSHCSKSTLSVSPNNVALRMGEEAAAAGGHLTSMALAYPRMLRKVRGASNPAMHPAMSAPPPVHNNMLPPPVHSNAMPFSLWRPTGAASLSKPASVVLDSAAEYQRRGKDADSVSSAGTSTTAESSLTATAAMVSRDWGAVPHTTTTSQGLGESPASAPGVYFQCGHPRLVTGQPCGATSSLAHALNRFNIDSDCEASSVASNSIVEDHAMMMDDDDAVSEGDGASVASYTSHTSVGSTKSQQALSSSLNSLGSQGGHMRANARKKKIGKTQRLMDRAAAHERILQIRSDRSRNMRASLVQLQRMGNSSTGGGAVSGLASAMEAQATPLSGSPCSTSSNSAASLPLVHVQHGAGSSNLPNPNACDLGRTPTASNCNADIRKLEAMGSPSRFFQVLPKGVHNSPRGNGPLAAPLTCHPKLATRIPTPPPRLAAGMLPSVLKGSSVSISSREPSSSASSMTPDQAKSSAEDESREEEGARLQHANHQATVDDVMDVALALSQLGERTSNPVPRIR